MPSIGASKVAIRKGTGQDEKRKKKPLLESKEKKGSTPRSKLYTDTTVEKALGDNVDFSFEPIYPIIQDELYFQLVEQQHLEEELENAQFQNLYLDDWFAYPDLRNYHGPSNIADIGRFAGLIKAHWEHVAISKRLPIRIISSTIDERRTNVGLLIAAYFMLVKHEDRFKAFQRIGKFWSLLPAYRTEGIEACQEHITIMHCLSGLEIILKREKLLSLENDVDYDRIAYLEQPLNGDMDWVLPGQILALAGPTEEVYPISEFIDYAKFANVGTVVRLNRPHHYESTLLNKAGIAHYDLFMPDGSVPALEQIETFLHIAETTIEQNKQALAVHCRAGLGRTGTMIAAYLIWKFGMEARQTIAFVRMMRPGALLGKQPVFLEAIQWWLRGETPTESQALFIQTVLPREMANALLTTTISIIGPANTANPPTHASRTVQPKEKTPRGSRPIRIKPARSIAKKT